VSAPRKPDLKTAAESLRARKAALEAIEAAVGDEPRAAVELDQTRIGRLSRMDALQVQAMSVETERRRKIELHRIEAALARIEDGDYGYCLACGAEIVAKRLALDPATPVCIDCAEKSDS